ncbi:unnamed protein product [Lactuca saligna]|uniref:Uncharacterized protein n=1 Tax=Lactuca saligna TaxID=75948 RepID=A0AA36E3V3_LACSI|nr:unnamed protein product [Lactuca saligna]
MPESDSSRDFKHPNHESTNNLHHQGSSLDRIILINPVMQGMVVIGGDATTGFESLMNDLMRKDDQPLAPQTSIDAMPTVDIKGTDEIKSLGGECVKNSSVQQFSRQWKPAPTFLYSSRL